MLHFGCLGAEKEVKIQLQNMVNAGVFQAKLRNNNCKSGCFLSFILSNA